MLQMNISLPSTKDNVTDHNLICMDDICWNRNSRLNRFDDSQCFWELFLNNLSCLYKMLKHKHAHKWHMYQLATMKYAYIKLYYQLNVIVNCWRKKGNIGIKIHYLCHDLEQCVRAKHSNAW